MEASSSPAFARLQGGGLSGPAGVRGSSEGDPPAGRCRQDLGSGLRREGRDLGTGPRVMPTQQHVVQSARGHGWAAAPESRCPLAFARPHLSLDV